MADGHAVHQTRSRGTTNSQARAHQGRVSFRDLDQAEFWRRRKGQEEDYAQEIENQREQEVDYNAVTPSDIVSSKIVSESMQSNSAQESQQPANLWSEYGGFIPPPI